MPHPLCSPGCSCVCRAIGSRADARRPVRDSTALPHDRSMQPCTRVASNINEIRIDDRLLSPDWEIVFGPILIKFGYIYRTRCWKSRTPGLKSAIYNDLNSVQPREVHDSLTKFLTVNPQHTLVEIFSWLRIREFRSNARHKDMKVQSNLHHQLQKECYRRRQKKSNRGGIQSKLRAGTV